MLDQGRMPAILIVFQMCTDLRETQSSPTQLAGEFEDGPFVCHGTKATISHRYDLYFIQFEACMITFLVKISVSAWQIKRQYNEL